MCLREDLAIRPTNERDFRRVAATFAKLERTGVATVAARHAGAEFAEELLERFVGTDGLGRETAGVEVVPLREGDQVIGELLELFGDTAGDLDFFIGDEVGHNVAEHRFVLGSGISGFEADASFAMNVLSSLCSHGLFSYVIAEV